MPVKKKPVSQCPKGVEVQVKHNLETTGCFLVNALVPKALMGFEGQ